MQTRFATTNTLTRRSYRRCLRTRVCRDRSCVATYCSNVPDIGNSFTPWFKLIARDFLFGWWDELLARKTDGIVHAKSLAGVTDGSKVVKMT
jgi:hypothetical protein